MGEYYIVVNHTKKQYMDPGVFGSGQKLFEISVNRGAASALVLLLTSHWYGDDLPSWHGDSIALIGDSDGDKYYDIINGYEDISKKGVKLLATYGIRDPPA